MANNKQEFIKNAFTPQIAVMCSPTVEQICQKNNLSFIELCQPFCKLNSDGKRTNLYRICLTLHFPQFITKTQMG